jgi:hypothetical protein
MAIGYERLSFSGLLLLLWSLAAVVHGLGRDARWLFIALALITAGVATAGLAVFVSRKIRGYWVEYVAPGRLREDDADFAVVYHEGSRELMLLGRKRPKPEADVLFVPPEGSWSSRVEPWALGRRAQILDRLRHHPVAGSCEIRSSSLP